MLTHSLTNSPTTHLSFTNSFHKHDTHSHTHTQTKNKCMHTYIVKLAIQVSSHINICILTNDKIICSKNSETSKSFFFKIYITKQNYLLSYLDWINGDQFLEMISLETICYNYLWTIVLLICPFVHWPLSISLKHLIPSYYATNVW